MFSTIAFISKVLSSVYLIWPTMTRKTFAKMNSKGHKGDSSQHSKSYSSRDKNDSITDSSVTTATLSEKGTLPNVNSLIKGHAGIKGQMNKYDLDTDECNYETLEEEKAIDCKDIRSFNTSNRAQNFDNVYTKANLNNEVFNKAAYLYPVPGEDKVYKDREAYGPQDNVNILANDYPSASSTDTVPAASSLVRPDESPMKVEDKTCDDDRKFVNRTSSHHLELIPAATSRQNNPVIDACDSHKDLADYSYQNHVSSWEHESDRFVEYSWRNDIYSQNLFVYRNNHAESNGNVLIKSNGLANSNIRTDNSYNQTYLSDGSCGNLGPISRRRRRRVQTPVQRTAANMRERRRMCHLNVAFDRLKERLPNIKNKQRLSRIQTLKAAIDYIHYLRESLSLC